MKKSGKYPVFREVNYLLLAPLLVLTGLLLTGIFFDIWIKSPEMILEYSLLAFGLITLLRVVSWLMKPRSRL